VDRRLLVAGVAIAAVCATSLGTAGTAVGATTAGGTAGAQKAVAAQAASTKSITGKTRTVRSVRSTTFAGGRTGAKKGVQAHELAPDVAGGLEKDAPGAAAAAKVAANKRLVVNRHLTPAGAGATKAQPGSKASVVRTGASLIRSFNGLRSVDSRLADNGNQFTNTPPDQAVCVGKGYVVEGVNSAVRVDTTRGRRGGVMSLNKFLGLPSAIVRGSGTTSTVYGPEPTDPTCVYDSSTGTFYFVALVLDVDKASGDLTGRNYLYIAVTQNPTGAWKIYRLSATNDGSEGSVVHPHCPCIGDYPHIGFDAYGFYVTTNEYSFFGPEYNSAQVYAFDKRQLARRASTVYVTEFDTTGVENGRNGFTLWPAHSPTARDFNRGYRGTEYFLSTNAAEEATGTTVGTSNSIVIWTLRGTSTLGRSHPSVSLAWSDIAVRQYEQPPMATQKDGPAPLRDCLNDAACVKLLLGPTATPTGETLMKLDASDTRMQQVMYSGGLLWGAHETAVKFGSDVRAGIAWYAVRPTGHSQPRGSIVRSGQFGVAGQDVTYPTIGMPSNGVGVIGFTLTGPSYYPSAAYAGLSLRGRLGPIRLAAAGLGPFDDFSGYKAFDYNRPRWGDYGAAAVDGNTVWLGTEYIGQRCTLAQYEATPFGYCNGTRAPLSNWYTRISQIRP
jgi:hypothetical protein